MRGTVRSVSKVNVGMVYSNLCQYQLGQTAALPQAHDISVGTISTCQAEPRSCWFMLLSFLCVLMWFGREKYGEARHVEAMNTLPHLMAP